MLAERRRGERSHLWDGRGRFRAQEAHMDSHAKIAGHAIHPMLIVFPLGLLATSLVFDILGKITGATGLALASYYMIPAGVVVGLAAAVFGLLDWLPIPRGSRARQVGAVHGIGNVIVVVLF